MSGPWGLLLGPRRYRAEFTRAKHLAGGRMMRPPAQVEDADRLGQATFLARCGNIASRAASSISVLKLCLSFKASARAAAGRALISPRWRCRLGSCLMASGPSTLGIRRDQPHTAMSTML